MRADATRRDHDGVARDPGALLDDDVAARLRHRDLTLGAKVVKSWVPVSTDTLCPKKAYSPTVISPDDRLNKALLTMAVEAMCSRSGSP
jgi:hypothetical protein